MVTKRKGLAFIVDAFCGFLIVGLAIVRQTTEMPTWAFVAWISLIAVVVVAAVLFHIKRD